MKFQVGSELIYTAVRDTTLILNVEAQHLPGQQVVRENLNFIPFVPSEPHIIPETGNRYRRVLLQPGATRSATRRRLKPVRCCERAENVGEVPIASLPLDVMAYLFPSRYVESDQLARFAWRRFGDAPQGHARVEAICDWIKRNVDYLEGSSHGSTSAYDTFTTRAGVCRDFAHLGITFCRALGIPARFVSAYGWKLEPQDFHAVFEAYLSGRWYLFDPTRLSPTEGVIRIGVGRDAADTAFATFFGELQSDPKRVWVYEVNGEAEDMPQQAVSLTAT